MRQHQESKENYLEAILVIKEKQGFVRSIDIANKLQFSKPSVSRAMGLLKSLDYIDIDDSGHIHLTDIGLSKANEILERHLIIKRFLTEVLGVDEDNAEEDACHMEHNISDQTFEAIKNKINRK